MVEEPTTVIRPPRPPRRHRTGSSRGRILARRLIAFAFILGVLAILVGSAWAILGRGEEEAVPPPAPLAPTPKALKIIFPEGFTRAQMGERIGEVNAIAREKRNVRPRLSPERYLALGAPEKSEMSAQMISTGWVIQLEAADNTYEYRADKFHLRLVGFEGGNHIVE